MNEPCHPRYAVAYGNIGYYCRKCDKLVIFPGNPKPSSYELDLYGFRHSNFIYDGVEIVWGISADGRQRHLNDLELLHDHLTGEYIVSVHNADKLDILLEYFTDWMRSHGCDTDIRPDTESLFEKNAFSSIEEAYAVFKAKAKGWLAC